MNDVVAEAFILQIVHPLIMDIFTARVQDPRTEAAPVKDCGVLPNYFNGKVDVL